MTVGNEKWWRDELTGDLELEVSRVTEPWMFDNDEHGIAAWKKVDFVFHWPAEKLLWLVEVKDADNPFAAGDSDKLIADFQSERLIYGSLAGKAKDSFLYLLLQDRLPADTKVNYVILFACARLAPEKKAQHYLRATRTLRGALGIAGPRGGGWAHGRLFIQDCMILSLDEWNKYIGARVPVRRLSMSHEISR